MRTRRHTKWLSLSLAGSLLAPACPLSARPPPHEEPQLFKLRFGPPSLLFEGVQRHETSVNPDGRDGFEEDTTSLRPSLELTADGSVYHPNFMQFSVRAVEGFDSERVDNTGGKSYDRSGTSFLQSYNTSAIFLREKPYASQVFADRNMFRREYDFFSTVTVDSQRYGLRSGYNAGAVPFSVSASRLDESVDDQFRPSTLTEDVATFEARSQRRDGDATDFSYTFDRYSRRDQGDFVQEGTESAFRLSDVELFGPRDRSTLNSTLFYYDLDSSAGPSRALAVQEWLMDKLRDDLTSTYRYSYDQRRTGDAQNDNHRGSVELRHQLYESLASSVDIHGERDTIKDSENTLERSIYGVSLGEDYTKRLSSWGRLAVGYHARLDRERRDTTGGSFFVIGEQHTLSDGTVTFLNSPSADLASIRVRDSDGVRIYLPDEDYVIVPHGNRVELRRGPAGLIPNGATVRVDYRAESPATSDYRSIGDILSGRLDFLGGLFGVYSRHSRQRYSGDGAPLEQEYNDTVLGADVRWRWLRAGAEFETQDSAQAPYRAIRCYEELLFRPTEDSSLSLDFAQTRITFPDEGIDHDLYRFTGRYYRRLSSALSFSAEGGREVERGFGYDRRTTIARSELDFAMYQLNMKLSYDLQDETYRGASRERRIIYLKVIRTL